MAFKKFARYVEEKERNGLADPDPGDVKSPHRVSARDLDLAKQAVQVALTRGVRQYERVYDFLRRVGGDIPEVNNLVDQMEKPRTGDAPKSREPDDLAPPAADSSPAFYQP